MLIGTAIYQSEQESEVKADIENNQIIQMQPDGVHEAMSWDVELDTIEDAKEAAKTIIDANEGYEFESAK